jgi:hypothetical protein
VIPVGVDIYLGTQPVDLRWGFDRLCGVIVPDVTEDQWHSVRCLKCQRVTQAKPKGRQRGMCGPNLIAILSLLVGVYHLSRRQAARCVGDLLGVDISIGCGSIPAGGFAGISIT